MKEEVAGCHIANDAASSTPAIRRNSSLDSDPALEVDARADRGMTARVKLLLIATYRFTYGNVSDHDILDDVEYTGVLSKTLIRQV